MPSYGSLHSPSLSKMNGNIESGSRRGLTSNFSFGTNTISNKTELIADVRRPHCWRPICSCDDLHSICMHACNILIFGNTWLISTKKKLAWLIAFVASLISDIRSDFPNFAWWAIAYMLCCIVGVLVVVASDSTQTYHVAVCLNIWNEDPSK